MNSYRIVHISPLGFTREVVMLAETERRVRAVFKLAFGSLTIVQVTQL